MRFKFKKKNLLRHHTKLQIVATKDRTCGY